MTREEIINEIKCLLSELNGGEDVVSYLTQNDVNWLNENIKALEQEPRWIPVSERLPNHDEYIKNNGLFNVSDGNRSYSEWFDIYDKQKFGEPTMSGFHVDYAVTAWVPLPKAYSEVEG